MRSSFFKSTSIFLIVSAAAVLQASAQKNVRNVRSETPAAAKSTETKFVPDEDQRAILDEINAIRTNPAKYAKTLEELKTLLDGNVLKLPEKLLLTKYGAASFDDAIRDLKSTKPLKPFVISAGMSAAAHLQLSDLKESLRFGHYGKDGSNVEKRLYKFGVPGALINENITYYSENARLVVLNMILDEGSPTKAHRKNLLSDKLKLVGIAYGKAAGNVPVCVLNFADQFEEKKEGKGPVRVM